MRELIRRVLAKCTRISFQLNFQNRFYSLGKESSLMSPFRVDGYGGILIKDYTVFQRGAWLYCDESDSIHPNPKLQIGSRCEFGFNNHISALEQIEIGDDVLTANNVYIADNIHGYEDISLPIKLQKTKFKKSVFIGSGSWLGENVVIIGASVGRNSVIGANAVVTSDIPDYCVAVGVPAKIIRRFDFNSAKWVDVNDVS